MDGTESVNDGIDGRTTRIRVGFWVIVLYCLLYIAVIGQRPLFVPDESRYAEIPREMVASGDWTKLRQAGLRYYEKPPLGYWLNAISISLLGNTPFAVRLPSALSAGISALAIFLLMRSIRKDTARALAGAVIYLSCIEVFGVGTFAVIDSMFSMFVTLSMVFFITADRCHGRRKIAWLALSGMACAAAFLTKGFTALVIPALTLLVWLIWEKRWRDLLHIWVLPIASAGIVVLPFAVALAHSNPDFWRYFFWVEHVQRFLEPAGGQHRQPFWIFLPVLAVGVMPWSFFLPTIVAECRKRVVDDSFARYCVCWFVMPFLFFSACGGKLPTYILPCFAPFAILAANALFDSRNTSQLRTCALVGSVIFVVALTGFLVWLPYSNQNALRESLFSDSKTLFLGVSIVLTSVVLYIASKRFENSHSRMLDIGLVGLSVCGMCMASFVFVPDSFENRRSPSRLIEEIASKTPENALIVSDRVMLPSVCWHYERDDVLFFAGKGELAYGIAYPESVGRYVETAEAAAEKILTMLEVGCPVIVFARDRIHPALAQSLSHISADKQGELSRYVWALYLPNGYAGGSK